MNTNPLDFMFKTPNGGYAIKTGKEYEFGIIPCRHTSNKKNKTDTYHYKCGVKLRIKWEGEEFFLV